MNYSLVYLVLLFKELDEKLKKFGESELRGGFKFDTLDDLIKQMEQDKLETLELFSRQT